MHRLTLLFCIWHKGPFPIIEFWRNLIFRITGVGNGDGSDLTVEVRADGLLIFECRVGEAVNCEVGLPEEACLTTKSYHIPGHLVLPCRLIRALPVHRSMDIIPFTVI